MNSKHLWKLHDSHPALSSPGYPVPSSSNAQDVNAGNSRQTKWQVIGSLSKHPTVQPVRLTVSVKHARILFIKNIGLKSCMTLCFKNSVSAKIGYALRYLRICGLTGWVVEWRIDDRTPYLSVLIPFNFFKVMSSICSIRLT